MTGSVRSGRAVPLPGAPSRPGPAPEPEGGASLVSVVVPVSERPAPLDELYAEFSAPFRERGRKFEFVFVLEPWAEEAGAALEPLVEAGEPVRILHSHQTLGEAGQLKLAGAECRGDVVLTLPAYRRVQAGSLPELVRRVEAGTDLVVAWRSPRKDSWINRLQNRAFHFLVGMTATRRFHDIACGVRAMRRALLSEIPLYGDFSRFLPLLAVQEGYAVEEVPCPQHRGDQQPRLYGPGTYLRRLIDLFGIFFLLRFTYKPLRFFGLVGSGLSLAGGVILLVLFFQRIGGQGIANRPMLLLGVLLFSLGVQVVALGLVGELIVHLHAPARLRYRIRSERKEERTAERAR